MTQDVEMRGDSAPPNPRHAVLVSVIGAVVLGLGFALGAFVDGHKPPASGREYGIDNWFSHHRDPFLNGAARVLEFVGGPLFVPWVLLALIPIFFLLKRRITAILFSVMAGLCWLPGHIAKQLFVRVRPPMSMHPVVIYKDTMSFPSGHTGFAVAFTVAGMLFAKLWQLPKAVTRAVVVVGVLWIVTMAVSRLYAAAHWPLDVLGGGTLALGTTMLLWGPWSAIYRALDKKPFWSESDRHPQQLPQAEARRELAR